MTTAHLSSAAPGPNGLRRRSRVRGTEQQRRCVMSSFSPHQAGYPARQSGWQQDPPAPVADSSPARGIHTHPEFQSMRRAYRRFGATSVALAVGGFLLYVLVSSFLPDVMNQRL